MKYPDGTILIDRKTRQTFKIDVQDETLIYYSAGDGTVGVANAKQVHEIFEVMMPYSTQSTDSQPSYYKALRAAVQQTKIDSALDTQVGGNHYKKLGDYQPWEVLQHWLTPEEFRGYMKGTAIAYLAREKDKGGLMDVEKAAHTLDALVELLAGK